MVFKKGDHGMGYYWDDPEAVEKQAEIDAMIKAKPSKVQVEA